MYIVCHLPRALEQAANICRVRLPCMAASGLKGIVLIAQDKKESDVAANYLERASAMYHESGHGDTAGQVLTKAAKLVGAREVAVGTEFRHTEQ